MNGHMGSTVKLCAPVLPGPAIALYSIISSDCDLAVPLHGLTEVPFISPRAV